MLATGLLIGSAGGAVATADTETTGSPTTQSQDVSEPSPSTTTTDAPATAVAQSPASQPPRPTLLRDLIRQLQAIGKPRAQTVVVNSTADPAADTKTSAADAGATATSNSTGSGSNVVTDSKVVATDSKITAQQNNVSASNSNTGGASTDLITPTLKVVQPVTNAVAAVAGAALSLPGLALSLPTSQAPIVDVLAYVQTTLVSVNQAVAPLAQVPSNLYSLLVVAAANTTPLTPVAGKSAVGLSTAVGAVHPAAAEPMPSSVLATSPIRDVPLLGDVTAPAPLEGSATAGLRSDLSLSGTSPLAAQGSGPSSALSFLDHTIRAVLAPASLTALAAFALPGIGGLLIMCAAGMRVGYRQAKAALAVRSSGIARFARQGPIGIVRSGSLVALPSRSSGGRRSRTLRVVHPDVSSATPPLEQVA
jgi:hypothetical protein